MSNYTTSIYELIENGDNIFTFDYPFYNELDGAKQLFEQKFKDVFMFYEIGFDDVEVFRHYLKTKMITLYPYYYQLYQTELRCKDIDFMLNKDLKETFTRELNREANIESTLQDTGNNTQTITGTDSTDIKNKTSEEMSSVLTDDYDENNNVETKMSDVNNGLSSAELASGYLTSVNKENTNNSYDLTENNSLNAVNESESLSTNTKDITTNNTVEGLKTENTDNNEVVSESTELISQGNIGVTSSAELLEKWRRVLIDIDMMLINDLATLFLKIY